MAITLTTSNTLIMTYEAAYLPALSKGQKDPRKGGFKTSEEAYEYIASERCDLCLKEIEALGEEAALICCDAEWMVFEEKSVSITMKKANVDFLQGIFVGILFGAAIACLILL